VKITLAQLNSVAGAISDNVLSIRGAIAVAVADGANVLLTPEKCLSGYPVEDLLGETAFLADVALAVDALAADVPSTLLAAIGAPMRADDLPLTGGSTIRGAGLDAFDRDVFNVVALAQGGHVVAAHSKALLPTYGVFDDSRWVVAGSPDQSLFDIDGTQVGFAICEDVWTPELAVHAAERGATVLLVANASPYYAGKPAERLALIRDTARESGMTIVYVNAVGGQDEVVYDGGSFVVDPTGKLVFRAPLFEEGCWTVDLTVGGPIAPWPTDLAEEMYGALVVGFRDYVLNNGFGDRGVILGLSGGLDSALAAVIAVDALGPSLVRGLTMPGPYSSEGSVSDALALAANLGIDCQVVPIRASYEAALGELGTLLDGPGGAVARENVQARIRGAYVMDTANAQGLMMVNTGNRSEAAVGYFTLGGDSSGGLAVLKDVLKTQAYDLARWRNQRGAPIPPATLSKPPSAELAPGQVDSNSLPPYPVLDAILVAYLEQMKPAAVIADEVRETFGLEDAGALVLRVLAMTDRAEHKRRQVAPGLMVSRRPFGRGRRMPITSKRVHHL
jgi:NAD+ synthase (glutamine-hydrolysing)